MIHFYRKEGHAMKGKIFTRVSALFLLPFLMFLLVYPMEAQAQTRDKVGWIGPVDKELSDSLTKGFKEFYKKTYNKEVDITFVRPGGWPVVVDKVRAWGGKPDADVFLGAGAPAHEGLKKDGLIVPSRPKRLDKVPAKWGGMKAKDEGDFWACFSPWIVTNLYNERVLKALKLPPPNTWEEMIAHTYTCCVNLK